MREVDELPEPWDGFLAAPDERLAPSRPEHFTGRRILVTGAGGYIGSALARALAAFRPECLLLLDIAEHGLYTLEQHLGRRSTTTDARFIVGSVCDAALLGEVCGKHAPDIVFHAAALKHVPLMESNPFTAAEANVLGTETVVRCARAAGTSQFVLLSTDKAVDPISVMGVTKRLAELIVLAETSTMQASAVRLVNVLGSTGSVAPLFAGQIARGESVTVTDGRATRYFLSLRDTISTLLAAAERHGPGLLLPEVGAAYRIEALAQFLHARVSDSAAGARLVYTGLRPGDKLHEQLVSARESMCVRVPGSNLLEIASPALANAELAEILQRIRDVVRTRDRPGLDRALVAAVPEYVQVERRMARDRQAQEVTW